MGLVKRTTVGLRYCGGCNSCYDRVAAVRRLSAAVPVEFVPAEPGHPRTLMVCGCSSRCVSASDLDGKLLWMCQAEDFPEIIRLLNEKMSEEGVIQ